MFFVWDCVLRLATKPSLSTKFGNLVLDRAHNILVCSDTEHINLNLRLLISGRDKLFDCVFKLFMVNRFMCSVSHRTIPNILEVRVRDPALPPD